MGQYDINLRDYWRIIRRRKFIIIFTTITLSFFSFVFAKLNEPAPIYSASTVIRIDENTTVEGIVSDSDIHEMAIATQTAVIRSYPVMERVAKELGLIDKSLSSEEIAKNSRMVSIINGIVGQVGSSQVDDTNLITVNVISGDPDQTARIANAISTVFRKYDFESKNHAILGRFKFIKGQLDESERKLRESEKRIKKFKENKKFLSLRIEASSISDLLQKTRIKVRDLEKSTEIVRDAIQQVRSIGEFKVGNTKRIPVDGIDVSLSRLNKQLVELQVKRDTLLENFTEAHPSVRTASSQIKNVIREMLLILQGKERTTKNELRIRRRELAKLETRNEAIPEISLQLERLERQLQTDMEVHNLLRKKMEEVNIQIAGRQHLVHIVKPAFRPSYRDNPPKVGINAVLGAILGLIVGLAFALVVETMDTSIGTIEDVESFLEVPVLGVVPTLDPEELEQQYLESNPDQQGRFSADIYGRLVTHFVPRSPIAEAYRSFRTQMDFLSLEKEGNVFLLTSATPGEGKTSTSINFAITYAQTNKRTLLIDCDMRRPTIYRIFGIDRDPGVTDILLGNYNWQECVRTMTDIMLGKFDMEDIMLTPGLDNLNILTCGNVPPNPSELLNSPRMTSFLDELREEFDVIILDTPPLLPVTDAAVLGTRVDGCVLVYRAGSIARGALKRAKLQLDNVRADVWGVVLNSMRSETSSDLDSLRYQSSYYYGGYVQDTSEENHRDLPVHERLYRKAKKILNPAEGSYIQQEASPLARALGAGILFLSLLSLGAGMAWKEGINVPMIGSLKNVYSSIGEPPEGALQNLEPTWKVTQEKTITRPAMTNIPDNQTSDSNDASSEAPQKPSTPEKPLSSTSEKPLWKKKQESFSFPSHSDRPLKNEKGSEAIPIHFPITNHLDTSRLASLIHPSPRSSKEKSTSYPYTIVYSLNRRNETTQRQLSRLRRLRLTPQFGPVLMKSGRWERVFLGRFPSRKEAELFLSRHFHLTSNNKSGPYIQKLPYAIQIQGDAALNQEQIIRTLKETVGLTVYFDKGKDGKRILVGAFKRPEEAQLTADILSRERIPFQLVAR